MMVEPDNREICPNKSVSVAFIGVSGLCEVEKSDRGPECPLSMGWSRRAPWSSDLPSSYGDKKKGKKRNFQTAITPRVFGVRSPKKNMLKRRFRTLRWCRRLRKMCTRNGSKYGLFNIVRISILMSQLDEKTKKGKKKGSVCLNVTCITRISMGLFYDVWPSAGIPWAECSWLLFRVVLNWVECSF